VVTHFNPANIQEGSGCHFHIECARTWTLQKDECSICKAGINPASILTADEIQGRSAMRKAEDITDAADRSSDDERLARELEAEGGAGAAAPADMDEATAALIAELTAGGGGYEGGFGAGASAAHPADMSDDDALAAVLAASGHHALGGTGAADIDVAIEASLRDVGGHGAPAAAAPLVAPVAIPAAVAVPAPAAGGVAPAMRNRCNQALVMVAGVAGAVAAIAFTMLQQKDN